MTFSDRVGSVTSSAGQMSCGTAAGDDSAPRGNAVSDDHDALDDGGSRGVPWSVQVHFFLHRLHVLDQSNEQTVD